MDVYQARLQHLLTLIEREGGVHRFAEKIGTSGNYISQITSAKIKRRMGAALARRIEREYRLPPGWMDQPHDEPSNEALTLAEKIEALPPERRAALRALIDSMVEPPSRS